MIIRKKNLFTDVVGDNKFQITNLDKPGNIITNNKVNLNEYINKVKERNESINDFLNLNFDEDPSINNKNFDSSFYNEINKDKIKNLKEKEAKKAHPIPKSKDKLSTDEKCIKLNILDKSKINKNENFGTNLNKNNFAKIQNIENIVSTKIRNNKSINFNKVKLLRDKDDFDQFNKYNNIVKSPKDAMLNEKLKTKKKIKFLPNSVNLNNKDKFRTINYDSSIKNNTIDFHREFMKFSLQNKNNYDFEKYNQENDYLVKINKHLDEELDKFRKEKNKKFKLHKQYFNSIDYNFNTLKSNKNNIKTNKIDNEIDKKDEDFNKYRYPELKSFSNYFNNSQKKFSFKNESINRILSEVKESLNLNNNETSKNNNNNNLNKRKYTFFKPSNIINQNSPSKKKYSLYHNPNKLNEFGNSNNNANELLKMDKDIPPNKELNFLNIFTNYANYEENKKNKSNYNSFVKKLLKSKKLLNKEIILKNENKESSTNLNATQSNRNQKENSISKKNNSIDKKKIKKKITYSSSSISNISSCTSDSKIENNKKFVNKKTEKFIGNNNENSVKNFFRCCFK